ncbi:hypothetical protein ETU08_08050 [Apibacter muscae]|uniref:hypothetical protein n=1 Tax=Apibacter muscae TaxID=2509004 RepID=UPI0011AC700F|nr:hypothetical protein [Apibacter muscae]TWP29226.1 hypothetical protein ETU08_08050 [Apibacter muscae]
MLVRNNSYAIFLGIECRFWSISDNFYRLQTEKNYISLSNNFKSYNNNELDSKVFLDVERSDIQSAYYVITLCNYKGYRCQIIKVIQPNKIVLNPPIDLQVILKNYAHHGYDPIYEIEENEVDEIWEERTPIEDFKFEIEPIYYIKKK